MSAGITKPACGACLFYVARPADAHNPVSAGECRFNPPTIIAVPSPVMGGQPHLNVAYPIVPPAAWCGRFTPMPSNLKSYGELIMPVPVVTDAEGNEYQPGTEPSKMQ